MPRFVTAKLHAWCSVGFLVVLAVSCVPSVARAQCRVASAGKADTTIVNCSATDTPGDSVSRSSTLTVQDMSAGGAMPRLAAFYGIGDLAGGLVFSLVRDATRVGGVIYAVGGSAANTQVVCFPNNPPGCVNQFVPDTAVRWTWNGTSGTLTPLPDLVSSSPSTTLAAASAITRDGAYIASQARSSVITSAFTQAVRVAGDTLATVNLGAAPYPALGMPAAATAISEDGSIVYGIAGTPGRAVRIDVATSSSVVIPVLSASDTSNFVVGRGVSYDGSVAVGTSFVSIFGGTNGRAFRYVHGAPGTVSAIPLLGGGTWNKAVAVSPDGRLVLAAGNSTFVPNGAMYLYDAMSATTTALGSPNTPWGPASLLATGSVGSATTLGGMTADGSVVVATFSDPTGFMAGNRHAYVRNAHGWFHLTTVLASQGIDISALGWEIEKLQATGISPDGTLVYGSGLHNGNTEGFVAEFPAGLLAAFDVPAVAPADPSIVGVWTVPGEPGETVIFLADGTYFHVDTSHGVASAGEFRAGFERGRYTWNASTGQLTFATLQDTNGSVGLSGANGALGITASVAGDSLSLGGGFVLTRSTGAPGSVVGGWAFGDPRVDNHSGVLVLLGDGTFMLAQDGDSAADPQGRDGVERGTYSWAANGTLTANVTLDTNGAWGLSNGLGPVTVTLPLSSDELHLGPAGPNQLTRIVAGNPANGDAVSVLVQSSPLGASITVTGTGCSPGTYTTPASLSWTLGATCNVVFASPQVIGGLSYSFASATVDGASSGNPMTIGPIVGPVTISATLVPAVIAAAIQSSPSGAAFSVSGAGCAPGIYTTPANLNWNANATCWVHFASPQLVGSAYYTFSSATVNGVPSNSNLFAVGPGSSAAAISVSFEEMVIPAVIESSPAGASFTVSGTGCAPGTYTTPANLNWKSSACSVLFQDQMIGGFPYEFAFATVNGRPTGNPLTLGPGINAATISATFLRLTLGTIQSSPSGASFSVSGTGCASGTYTTPTNLVWQREGTCIVTFANELLVNGAVYGFAGVESPRPIYPPYLGSLGTNPVTIQLDFRQPSVGILVDYAPCSYSVSQTDALFFAGANRHIIRVNTSRGCSWSAVSGAPWITILWPTLSSAGGPPTGMGEQGVSFSVAQNPGAARTGTLVIAGQTVTVRQLPCSQSIVLSNESTTFAYTGGDFSLQVGLPSGCGTSWTAVSNTPSWLHVISGATGSGTAKVTLRADANHGGARSGTATIAGFTFFASQAAAPPPPPSPEPRPSPPPTYPPACGAPNLTGRVSINASGWRQIYFNYDVAVATAPQQSASGGQSTSGTVPGPVSATYLLGAIRAQTFTITNTSTSDITGNLYLVTRELPFTDVQRLNFQVLEGTNKTIYCFSGPYNGFLEPGDYILPVPIASRLQPGQSAQITLTWDYSYNNRFGFSSPTPIYVILGGLPSR